MEEYGASFQDVPLFSDRGLYKKGQERRKAPPTAGWAFCPLHESSKKTGLVHLGEHLVWKVHYIKLAKSSIPCRASGSALCVCAPEDGYMRIYLPAKRRSEDSGIRPGLCPHDARRTLRTLNEE